MNNQEELKKEELAEEIKEKEAVEEVEEEEGNYLVMKLSKPYKFEGKTYEEIDIQNIEDAKGADAIEVIRIMKRSGSVDANPEFSLEFSLLMASRAAGQPFEFFAGLPAKDALGIKRRVNRFFIG